MNGLSLASFKYKLVQVSNSYTRNYFKPCFLTGILPSACSTAHALTFPRHSHFPRKQKTTESVQTSRETEPRPTTSLVVARARVAIIYRKWPPGELCRVHFNNPAIKFALWRHTPCASTVLCSIIYEYIIHTYNVQQNTWPCPVNAACYLTVSSVPPTSAGLSWTDGKQSNNGTQ